MPRITNREEIKSITINFTEDEIRAMLIQAAKSEANANHSYTCADLACLSVASDNYRGYNVTLAILKKS